MKNLRILIVEDDSDLNEALNSIYQEKFRARGFASIVIERTSSVNEARRLAKEATRNPYDFVSLDVNLGDPVLTGLDVLSTLRRFHSAWMVALLTGVETDETLDGTIGFAQGIHLRRHLRQEAYSRFPAERLQVVEKPASSMPEAAATALLADRLEQIVAVYKEVSKLRYIFRPIEVISLERVKAVKGGKPTRKFIESASTHWQIRFDCGDLRTLPNKTGFRTLHRLLSLTHDETLTPEAALVAEPANEKACPHPAPSTDPVAAFFEAKSIHWNDLDDAQRSQLVKAALAVKFVRFQKLRELQDEEDLSPNEEDELKSIIRELGPLADAAETAYERLRPAVNGPSTAHADLSASELAQNEMHIGRGHYDQLGANRRGQDSPEAALFRARMKRVKDCLRENGFADFADHLDDYVHSSGASWSYHPPVGVEWTV